MVQFNLLPDVKQAYIRARRTKQMVLIAATLAAAASLFVMILLLVVVDVLQKKHLSDVNKDISTYTTQIKKIPDLTKILTIQNQLKSLPGLDAQKAVTSRLFGYLGQLIPEQVNLSSITINYSKDTMQFTGTADTLDRVNTFVDTLKFTNYSATNQTSGGKPAFSNVVLSSFSRSTSNTKNSNAAATSANFTINTAYDEAIFSASNNITQLLVPANKITTRSETEDPHAALFITPPSDNTGGGITGQTGQ